MTGNTVRLNPQQKEAVNYPDNRALKILAGAGTGKTQVLTQRFLYLVSELDYEPLDIVCLTFTNKAAEEMKSRIVAALLEQGRIKRKSDMATANISSFHAFCRRVITENPFVIPIDPQCSIVQGARQRRIMEKVCQRLLDLEGIADPELIEMLERIPVRRTEQFIDTMLHLVSKIKDSLLFPAEFKKKALSQWESCRALLFNDLTAVTQDSTCHPSTRKSAARKLERLEQDFGDEKAVIYLVDIVYTAYQQALRQEGVVDFGDLLMYAHAIVKAKPELRENYRYILVDEFQDTNNAQFSLLKLIAREGLSNVTIVGDKKQSIYEWREARPDNVDEVPGETVNLVHNYRSSQRILDTAYHVLAEAMPGEAALTGSGIHRDVLDKVTLYRALTRRDEALFIADRIRECIQRGNSYDDMVVLMRGLGCAPAYRDELERQGIPAVILGASGFFEQAVVKDLLALLHIVQNPYDDNSWVRVLTSPLVNLSDAHLAELLRGRGRKGLCPTVVQSIRDSHVRELPQELVRRLKELYGLVFGGMEFFQKHSLADLVRWLIVESRFPGMLAVRHRESEFSVLNDFLSFVHTYVHESAGQGIEDFFSYIELCRKSDEVIFSETTVSGKVRLMSIHQAKGLEFPYVFVVNVKPGSFPARGRTYEYTYSGSHGVVVKNSFSETRPSVKYAELVREEDSVRQLAEERRILYVAVTRAQKGLYVTSSETSVRGSDLFEEIRIKIESELRDAAIVYKKEESKTDGGDDTVLISESSEKAVTESVPLLYHKVRMSSLKGQEPIVTLSFSQLARYEACPLSYRYRYVDKLPVNVDTGQNTMQFSGDRSGANGLVLGDILHKLLRLYHYNKRVGEPFDENRLFEVYAKLAAQYPLGHLYAEGTAILGRYIRSPLADRETLDEEKPFTLWLEERGLIVNIKGKIDRIDVLEDHLQVIDYKSHVKIDRNKYKRQLAIYKMAIHDLYASDKEVRTSLYFLRSGKTIDLEFSPSELQAIRLEIMRAASSIQAGKFSRGRKAYCKLCEYAMFCPHSSYHKPRRTMLF